MFGEIGCRDRCVVFLHGVVPIPIDGLLLDDFASYGLSNYQNSPEAFLVYVWNYISRFISPYCNKNDKIKQNTT